MGAPLDRHVVLVGFMGAGKTTAARAVGLPVESTTPPARFDRNGFHEISWTRYNFAFTCVSDLDPAELTVLVNLLKRG